MFAHVTAGTVDDVRGFPPDLAFDGTRWWDLRTLDPVALTAASWYPVTEAPRPADTASTTWAPVYTLNGAAVTQSWVEVPKTPEQLQAELEDTNRRTIEEALGDFTELDAILATANGAFTTNTLGAAVKVLARAIRRIIRLLIRRFDGTT